MPIEFLDRLPIPNLRVYTAVSFAVLSCSVYYAVLIIKDPAWKSNHTYVANPLDASENEPSESRNLVVHMKELFRCMLDEPICIWTLINMAYCVLILLGKTIQRLVFGELRASERQHLKDKFWNFVFYKFIFVFGVLNLQYMDEVILWWAWFTALGFLNLLSQLCKDRFEYLSFSPTTTGWSHARLLVLLATILALSSFMLLLCTAAAFFFVSFNTFVFISAECIMLGLRTMHVMVRYIIHLYDTRGAGTASQTTWDKRGPLTYYTDLVAELVVLTVEFCHNVHMLLWSNIFLSMASLVICMQLRYLFYEIQRKISKHRNYLAVLNHMEQNYPMASQDDLAENPNTCAICWEKMVMARKLPCGHLFHNSCLQSWLEQDTSCPTCRLTLTMQPTHREIAQELPTESETPERRAENHFFHFDGSRYVAWLPRFSLAVSPPRRDGVDNNSQMDAMIRQVQQLFPHFPRNQIVEDLRITRSVEWTVENILDGVLNSTFHLIEEPEPEFFVEIIHTRSNVSSSSLDSLPSESTCPGLDISLADSGEEPSSLGVRFSKSPAEREQVLQRRKELMRLAARRKYFQKLRSKLETEGSVSNATSET